MSEVNGNVMTPTQEPAPVDGNKSRHGSYSYRRGNGGMWCIYKADSKWSATKQAEIIQRGEEGRLIAANMVAALNSRERYLNNTDFNKQQ